MRINILAATIITCYLLPITCILFLSEKWILCLLHSDGRWRTMSGYTTVSLGSTNKRLQI